MISDERLVITAEKKMIGTKEVKKVRGQSVKYLSQK